MPHQIYHSVNESTCGWKKDGQEKFVLVGAILAIFFSVCVFAMTLADHMHETNKQVVATALNHTPIACVPCRQLFKDVNDTVDTDPMMSKLSVMKDEGGTNKCCAYNSAQISLIFELAMRQETMPERLLEFDPAGFSFSPVSAHKRLYPIEGDNNQTGPRFEVNNKLVATRFKKDIEPVVEHVRGVDVREEGLYIVTSGRYYIYSSIHIRPDSSEHCKEFKYQTWGHYIEKVSPNDPASSGCILRSAHTCCDECAGDDSTNFTGGVFELKQGDIIRIKVTGHRLVYFRKFSSFAGLMMLGGGDVSE